MFNDKLSCFLVLATEHERLRWLKNEEVVYAFAASYKNKRIALM